MSEEKATEGVNCLSRELEVSLEHLERIKLAAKDRFNLYILTDKGASILRVLRPTKLQKAKERRSGKDGDHMVIHGLA